MVDREWHYLENSEEIATRENFKKMMKITNYQTSGINAQVLLHPEIILWKARRDPFAFRLCHKEFDLGDRQKISHDNSYYIFTLNKVKYKIKLTIDDLISWLIFSFLLFMIPFRSGGGVIKGG
jgi:hypothetical protein